MKAETSNFLLLKLNFISNAQKWSNMFDNKVSASWYKVYAKKLSTKKTLKSG